MAAAQGLGTETVQALVERNTSSGLEAFLGQPSVNVTALNLDVVAAAASAAGEQGIGGDPVEE